MPIPVVPVTGGLLEGARLDAILSFPDQIKQLSKNWRTGFPATAIDDNPVEVVQGTQADNTPVKFYFDKKTGLLLRQVRYMNTPIGFNPTQIDYGDYRDVSGIQMPFKLTVTWTDGRSIIELSQVRANVAVDAARFSKPQASAR